MKNLVRRVFVEKKSGYNIEAEHLLKDLIENLRIEKLEGIRILNCYDISGVSDEEYEKIKTNILSEPNVDSVYDEKFTAGSRDLVFAMEYLPGQYDQRADSAEQCVQIFTQKERPNILNSKYFVLEGEISEGDFEKIKKYCINPVDSREASMEKPESLELEVSIPDDVKDIEGFIDASDKELEELMDDYGFAMSMDDLKFCQNYFKNEEKRNPTITEIRVIDTYWSDHCRHTTFLTEIENVEVKEGKYSKVIEDAYKEYLDSKEYVYEKNQRATSLMDIAVIGMKELRKKGKLDDLDVSEEINACSIVVEVDVDGKPEEYLVMFKNETHNHPTEIEPFGGAATCLGGAIRDPLSGRSYVYQAMRVTGSADPRTSIEETLPGKLPQRKITTEAAHGYSSYGNQIGLATGQVSEVYDEDFVAKRMEVGAVIAAAPKENVVREAPQKGDLVILVGGKTGRDGCGGATGSSKEHDEESILNCGAEVQKGNPPTERKIQRLFRNPDVSKMIKRCNDFGAGGVSVAIGELTDSLEIDLDKVPKKYDGLDGTELAISESQERMAVVVEATDAERFIEYSKEENLEATTVAEVTDSGRLIMKWRGKSILDISREFLETNGVKQKTEIVVEEVKEDGNYFRELPENLKNSMNDLKKAWIENLKDLNIASQKGLTERFDSTIGANTVLMPLGGKYQITPAEGMVSRIPLLEGETKTGTIMTYGYNPKIGKWSPFHGALYAVLESVAKVVAIGGSYEKIRLSLQEYFEKLGKDPAKWGKPFSALLGANYIQKKLEIPAIGGKDSMSGTFKDINVPPTLISFAVDTTKIDRVVSPEFKGSGSRVVNVPLSRDEFELPDFEMMTKNFQKISSLIKAGKVLAAQSVRNGGIASAVSKMSFGNRIGMKFTKFFEQEELFRPDYGSIILEVNADENLDELFGDIAYDVIGMTQKDEAISVNGIEIDIQSAEEEWKNPLERIFPTEEKAEGEIEKVHYVTSDKIKSKIKIASPRVFIPVFPGTNCEYDTSKVFTEAGGIADTLVFKNLEAKQIEDSIDMMVEKINKSQIIAIPGGFSAGDEPDGSGKFIATAFRNPRVKEAVMNLLKNRDGLMIGICNGFQALIKLGLVPYGEIREMKENAPTLTFNKIGRHVSCLTRTKIVSNLSPWLADANLGDVHTVALSHGEGRFVADEVMMNQLIENGQIATQYVDFEDNPTYDINFNPNGSFNAVEGITSPDGRVFGKMGHTERMGDEIGINVPGNKDKKIFESGIKYFK